jgi:hypothetical protein
MVEATAMRNKAPFLDSTPQADILFPAVVEAAGIVA